MGFVAAVSDEARQAGVRVGLPLAQARLACPEAAFRRGDLDAYGRHSEEVTAVLLAASRRVERPSADEAFVDLTRRGPATRRRCARRRRSATSSSAASASTRRSASPPRASRHGSRPAGRSRAGSSSSCPATSTPSSAGKPVSPSALPPHLVSALERAGLATRRQGRRLRRGCPRRGVGAAAAGPPRRRARGAGAADRRRRAARLPPGGGDDPRPQERPPRPRGDRGCPRPARGAAAEAVPPRRARDRRRGAAGGRQPCGARRLHARTRDEDAIAAGVRALARRCSSRPRACAGCRCGWRGSARSSSQAPLFLPRGLRRAL